MADEKKSVREVLSGVREAINQSRVGKIADWFADNFGAFTRQGAKELAQVLPAFPDSVKPVEELGTLGNPTQLEVNEETRSTGSPTVLTRSGWKNKHRRGKRRRQIVSGRNSLNSIKGYCCGYFSLG
jgi:hypothetical protein